MSERKCRMCGCTETTPCPTLDGFGCYWVADDLCSLCCEANDLPAGFTERESGLAVPEKYDDNLL